MTTPDEYLEPPEGGSRAAGSCVLVALPGGAIAAVFAASTEAGILTLSGAAVAALWWAVRRVPHAANPAPPPPPEGATNTKPLFTAVDDPDNPNRSHIVWHTQKEA